MTLKERVLESAKIQIKAMGWTEHEDADRKIIRNLNDNG
jgi:hypothetical protein